MRGGREFRCRRPWRRAAGAGSGRAVSRPAHPGAVERSRRIGRAPARGTGRSCRWPASTSSSARNWSPRATIFPSSIWSASSTAISASPTPIPARPSAPSSCCIRSIGRAGREAGRGHGYLQTHQPEHPVMRALIAGDREAFYASEIALREQTHYPPFGRLASLLISGPDKHATESYARQLAAAAPRSEDVRVLGPAEAPLALVRGPFPLPPAGEIAARLRSLGLSAAVARRGAEGQRQDQARGRHRSAELSVRRRLR